MVQADDVVFQRCVLRDCEIRCTGASRFVESKVASGQVNIQGLEIVGAKLSDSALSIDRCLLIDSAVDECSVSVGAEITVRGCSFRKGRVVINSGSCGAQILDCQFKDVRIRFSDPLCSREVMSESNRSTGCVVIGLTVERSAAGDYSHLAERGLLFVDDAKFNDVFVSRDKDERPLLRVVGLFAIQRQRELLDTLSAVRAIEAEERRRAVKQNRARADSIIEELLSYVSPELEGSRFV